MLAHHYPFIDLAVHASVRARFAKGDAVAILSEDLGEVLWANGAAAHLFGFDSIYDVLEQGLAGQTTTRRQIESALSGLRRSGKPQNFVMRVAGGFSRTMAPASLEHITLPDGARALMLCGSQAGPVLGPGARARRIIAGFEGTGTHVAVLDSDGRILAASRTFGEIGLADGDIARMIADVATEEDRLVKRMAASQNGPMPAAIGRLADDPVLHLLFAVEPAPVETIEDAAHAPLASPGTASAAEPSDAPAAHAPGEAAVPLRQDTASSDARDETGGDAATVGDIAAPSDGFDADRVRRELDPNIGQSDTEADIPLAFAEARGLVSEPPEQAKDEGRAEPVEARDADEAPVAPSANASDDARHRDATAAAFTFDPNARPARFVWKIDREGAFSEVSPEFAAAVGPQAADIIGRKFPDLARVFNLDPDHVITDLLNRRDTWSGKTVYWPIQGTELVTPVDLAALPTYTRDRHFDGFRGFGIVRSGESRKDPEALGLALIPGSPLPGLTEIPTPEVDAAATPGETPVAESAPPEDQASGSDQSALEAQDLELDVADLARMDGANPQSPVASPGGDDDSDRAQPAATEPNSSDPFRGERPAIRLVETPMRRDNDKIISLEARRPRSRDSLSPGEQAAFREIGARLNETTGAQIKEAGGRPARDTESAAPTHPEDHRPFGKRAARSPEDQPVTSEIDVEFDNDAAAASPQTGEAETEAGNAPDDVAGAATAKAPEPVATRPGPAPLPSAFALPPRQVMRAGLDPQLVDALPVALLVHSGDALIHANAEFLALTGYGSLEQLSELGGLDHLLEQPGEEDDIDDGGVIVRRGDGGSRRVAARLRSVNWADGQALLLALLPIGESQAPAGEAAALPMAEQVSPEAEAAIVATSLQIEAQELRSILETATDGVVILDHDGTIRSMNGSACALFNYDEAETRKQPFAMLFAHESQRAVMDYVSGLAEHGVSSVLNDGREVIGREASGGFLPLFMTIGRLTGSNGYCAVLRDITQWKRTEDELRTAKRAAETANSHKSDFLARVSHEIRTPLNAIIGFSEMMAEERFGSLGSPRYLEYAHDIGNSGKHVLDIVNDLLDISKIEAGQVDMEFVSVSLNDHLAESVSLLQPMANSQRLIIRTSLSASVPEVVADQRSIKQIALNLLSNAIRYTPSGGQIVVSTSYEPSGNVVIRIRDTGVGMNRKELEQAMKPFGQVGPGPRPRGEGTGLGLPLTKAMVEANRAQFEIVSAPGEGTLVSIAFPPQRVLAD